MFVNLGFAIPAALGAVALLRGYATGTRTKLDVPGTLAATAGLFGIVYGFSSAEMNGWGDVRTIASLAAGVALLAAFVAIEMRVERPLLPLRVLGDRTRAGSFLAVLTAGAGIFGVFLFLTYYLQETLGFSPVQTGLAFLPMVATVIVTSVIVDTKVMPRTGPRPLVPTGMILATTAMLYLTGIEVDSSYAAAVLPALLVLGAGFGMIMPPSMSAATFGVRRSDTGVASALVNTCQQVGGSIGTALLSTISATAVTNYVTDNGPGNPAVMAQGAVHGYTTAFWFSAAIFAAGAIAAALLLRSGPPQVSPDAEPAFAH
jgi:predicted MFS family arabinose efflux permease